MLREVRQVVTGTAQEDGAGVKLVRVIGHDTVKEFDPFLMLDAFDSTSPDDYIKGFPWHPHRGIETVTYLIEGLIEHGDSLGNEGDIQNGCCQWMTAGGGIIHQEMPKPSPRMLGVQLWLNLPAKDKMTTPQYRDIRAHDVPRVSETGTTVGVLSGRYKETEGPVSGDFVKTLFLDIDIEAGQTFSLDTDPEDNLFVYIVSGEGYFDEKCDDLQSEKRALLFGQGSKIVASASENGMRLLLFAGKPLHEPIAWGGPIVMNTREELNKAFKDIKAGTFIMKPNN